MAYTNTREDPQRYPPLGGLLREAGKSVAAHPVAQLSKRIFRSPRCCNAMHRSLIHAPIPFHTTYDGEGKRVKKIVGNEETIFVYSAGKLVAEYSTSPALNPSTHFTTSDHLGSPRIITNHLGQATARRDFMPFGEELNLVGARSAIAEYSADSVRQKFTGYQKDEETELDFAEARMYETRHGRFTAVDPLLASGKSGNPQTFNRYIYVGNNPIMITDPLGLEWWHIYSRNTNTRSIFWDTQMPVAGDGETISTWEQYVYRASDGMWYSLDPSSDQFSKFFTQERAEWDNGVYTNFNGYGSVPVYNTMLHMVSGIKTGNVGRAMFGFWATAGTLATAPRSIAGVLKEGVTETASALSGLPIFNPRTMFSKRNAAGLERASEGLLDLVSKKRHVIFARPGTDDRRRLDLLGAEASFFRGTNIVTLRENPSKVAVMEEFLHGTQDRLGVVERLGRQGAELHVNKFMLRHKRMLDLTPSEIRNVERTIEQIKSGIY